MISLRKRFDDAGFSAAIKLPPLIVSCLLLSLVAPVAALADARLDYGQNEQAVLPYMPTSPPLMLEPPPPAQHTFTLRHIYHHGTYRYPELHRRLDVVHPEAQVRLMAEDGFGELVLPSLTARSRSVRLQRLADRRPSVVDPIVAQSREQGFVSILSPDAWTLEDIPGPDVTDKTTVHSMALIAANAYVSSPDGDNWEDVGGPLNQTLGFGWEDDGIRGHIWTDETNSTIVIGVKGTSVAVFDGDGTTTNDKLNDNLFFSCCCAQQGPWTWHQVCDCATDTYMCNNTCIVQALRQENRYYQAARELYANVTEKYPESNVWVAGHSLGGALSSFIGLTYGVPVVTFEAVPEALPAKRLGLPIPPGADPDALQTRKYTAAHHFGHTADPIYIGTCNGATASCSFGGYAMESACHTGMECTYDTVGDLGWRVGIGTHKIRSVIHDVIEKYDTVPMCQYTPECRDCGKWKMYESNGSDTTTTTAASSTSSKPRTRTETCKTPGWFGCLDETTTTDGTATSAPSTPTSTTTTCHTPGWFGCKDKTTTTEAATSPATTIPSETGSPSTTATTTTCEMPGFFWGCKDETTSSPDSLHEITPAPFLTTPVKITQTSAPGSSHAHASPPQCLQRNFLGWCREWEVGDGDTGPIFWEDQFDEI